MFGFTVLLVYAEHPNVRLGPACITLVVLVGFEQLLVRLPRPTFGTGFIDLRLPWVTLLLILLCRFADPLSTPIYLTVAAAGLFEAARNPTRWRLLAIPGIPLVAIAPAVLARPAWMLSPDASSLASAAIGLPMLIVLGSLTLLIAMRERRNAKSMVHEQWRLRKRQKIERTALEAIDEPVLLLDRDLKVLDYNHDAVECLGNAIERRHITELIRPPEGYEPIPDAKDLQNHYHAVEAYTATGPKRGKRWSLDVRRMPTGSQELARWVAVLHSSQVMVDQVKHEEERFRKLEEAALQRQQFLRLMSHELRTPLHAILGFTELLLLEKHGELTDERRASLELIQQTGHLLQGSLDDVREFVRQGDRPAFDIDPYDIGQMAAETALLIASTAEKNQIVLTVVPPPATLMVNGNWQMTSRALLNIMSNAIQFTPPGGRISVRVMDGVDRIEVEVEDTGVGISWTEQARVFEPFDRGRTATTRDTGTGMGLAVARRLVERQGGVINLRSRPGQGSTFSIAFPKDETPDDAEALRLERLVASWEDIPVLRMEED